MNPLWSTAAPAEIKTLFTTLIWSEWFTTGAGFDPWWNSSNCSALNINISVYKTTKTECQPLEIYIYCMLKAWYFCVQWFMHTNATAFCLRGRQSQVHVFDSQHHRNWGARDHSQLCDDQVHKVGRRHIVHQVEQAQRFHLLPVLQLSLSFPGHDKVIWVI